METTANPSRESILESTPFWYVYLLRCCNGKVYVGCTSNLDDRLRRHRDGEVSFTKRLLPVELICYTAFPDKYTAFTIERYLKSGSGRAFARRHWR
jgi:predicted GIY-YIG superfamily endonuclease